VKRIIMTRNFIIALLIATPALADEPTTKASTESIPKSLIKFEMIHLPGGKVNDKEVKPFWIGKYEVTWDEMDVWAYQLDLTEKEKAAGEDAESRPSKPYGAADRGYGHSKYPAISLNHLAARLYCLWLSNKTGKKYRLPTEVEWRYACMAGTEAPPQGQTLLDYAWVKENSLGKTHPVGQKKPNAFGLYDTLGNVGEWCTIEGETKVKDAVLLGGSFKMKSPLVNCETKQIPDEDWNASDPQNPKSIWWLADGNFCGFRIVREDDDASPTTNK
jgi:formylglycine-generating enzyme required for sulfatase activity